MLTRRKLAHWPHYLLILSLLMFSASVLESPAHANFSIQREVKNIRVQCESFEIWSPGLQSSQNFINERMSVCRQLLDSFNINILSVKSPALSEKKAIVHELEAFLRFVRFFSNSIREQYLKEEKSQVGVTLSQATAIEHSIRLSLSILREFEAWEGQVTLGTGVMQTRASRTYLGGLRAGLQIDLGQNIEGFTEIEMGSPRKEGTGLVKIPLETSDLLYISQMWIKSKKIRRIHLWLGVVPEEDDELAPTRWPFLTLGIKMNTFSGFNWTSFLLLRHDTYGIWDYSLDSYKPSRIERNLSSLEFRYSPYFSSEQELNLAMRFQLHWYSDPNGTLTRLNLGRYEDVIPSNREVLTYRVAKIDETFSFHFSKNILLEHFSTIFWNIETEKQKLGKYLSFGTRMKINSWSISPRIYGADIDCQAIPPLALNASLFPNHRTQGLSLELSKLISERTSIDVQLMAQNSTLKSTKPSCTWNSKEYQQSHELLKKLTISLQHKFSSGFAE